MDKERSYAVLSRIYQKLLFRATTKLLSVYSTTLSQVRSS